MGISIPFFTHNESYQRKFAQDSKFQRTRHNFIKFRGTKTKGTNEFLNSPISVIVGTPFLPPSYFMHPVFRDEFRSDAEIQRDVDERKKEVAARRWANPIYPVKPVLSEEVRAG